VHHYSVIRTPAGFLIDVENEVSMIKLLHRVNIYSIFKYRVQIRVKKTHALCWHVFVICKRTIDYLIISTDPVHSTGGELGNAIYYWKVQNSFNALIK